MFRKKKKEQREAGELQRIVIDKGEKPKRLKHFFRELWGNFPWIFWGAVCSLVCAAVFCCYCIVFHAGTARRMQDTIENAGNIKWLYQNCYLFYRDLYNAQNEPALDYCQLYLKLDEDYGWIQERSRGDVIYEFERMMEEAETEVRLGNNGVGMLTRAEYEGILSDMDSFNSVFQNIEGISRNLNARYDYRIVDRNTGYEITNMSQEDKNRSLSRNYFLLTFEFDEKGNVSIGEELCAQDEVLVRRLASEAVRGGFLPYSVDFDSKLTEKYGTLSRPKNCSVTFAISREAWNKNPSGYDYVLFYADSIILHSEYERIFVGYQEGAPELLLFCMAAMTLLGFWLPVRGGAKPWRKAGPCSLPLEALLTVIFFLGVLNGSIQDETVRILNGSVRSSLAEAMGISRSSAGLLVFLMGFFAMTLYFFAWWYIGVSFRAVRDLKVRGYIRERVVFYRIFPWLRKKAEDIYQVFLHMDLTRNANAMIWKIVLVNALILAGISCFWVGGFALIVVYSLVLYCILRKYISDLQDKYQVLLRAANEMAEGRLNVTIDEDLGVFEPFKPQVLKIQQGFQKAVDEEVKSQRMKAELITNVSHDLKTPLTAIITYVNLLKEENTTEEQRKEYLDTLERKSLRLKALIEDLFEVSKANSRNITLNIMDVDIMNLLKQVEFEMADKLEASRLEMRMNLTDERIILPLDSQKTYRVFENLFGNIAKYAMPGTRVYVRGFCQDERVYITLKNISAQEITVDSSELLERFVRGDASRNTEGSGLGLAIARSFTQLQGGELELEVDGDLFKVTVSWKLP